MRTSSAKMGQRQPGSSLSTQLESPTFSDGSYGFYRHAPPRGAFLPSMPHTWRIALRCMRAVPNAMARNGWMTHKTAAFGHGHSLSRITSTNSEPRSDSIRYAPFPTPGRRFHKNNKKPSRRPPDGGTNGWPAKDG